MKKKIIAYLALLVAFFSLGSLISMLYMTFTTSELKKIISLHSVEILRQDLIIKMQNVQQDLLTVHTEFGNRLDAIVLNVQDLDDAVNNCRKCHHTPEIDRKLDHIRLHIDTFKSSLSSYITAADKERMRSLKLESYGAVSDLLTMTTEMAFIANKRLQEKTQTAIEQVKRVQQILVMTLLISILAGLWISVRLTKNILTPIRRLMDVSRKIASGNLGSTTTYTDPTEFGELAASVNDMSLSLRESNEKILQNLNRLADMYRITLPLHSVSSLTEIIREVSYGVAEFFSVEQCGLLLLDHKGGYFEHACPAFGLDELQAASLRSSQAEVLELYRASEGQPLIINELRGKDLPEGLAGKEGWTARNLLFGWVRQEGALTGVIRLANRTDGGFDEESRRLLGIISNNLSVAIENVRLHEDLQLQMQELKEAQEQLVQAAKLAAIGELASYVAHEINNPLTSILGYAELIKDETNLENIMRDVDIIINESFRARDIVQQLLEFARRRPLNVQETDLNSILKDVISLVRVNFKGLKLQLHETYAELPLIMGDPNQLKQVFLNIMNNAIDSLSDSGGEITIRTMHDDTYAVIEIADTGHGVPQEVLPRIFEPFFTTKKEKGTGLGLPISYRIIEAHKGKMDVKSTTGRGTVFSIFLPLIP